jgi:hypothetical protein
MRDRFFGAVAAGAGVAPIDRPRRTFRCKTFRRGPSSARPAVRIADASMHASSDNLRHDFVRRGRWSGLPGQFAGGEPDRSGAAARRSSLELLHLLFYRQRFARDRCRRPFSGCWLDHGELGFRRYHQRVCRAGALLWRQIHARLEISDPHRTRCAQRESIPRGQSRRSRSVANEQRGLVCDHNEIKLLRPTPNQRRETDRSARRWKARWNPSG